MIAAVGAAGLVSPSILLDIARPFTSSSALPFYGIAAVRIAFGLVLVAVAPASRAPRALRAVGFVVVMLGVAAAIAASFAVAPARGAIESWSRSSAAVLRLTAVSILALGSFVAWACAPGRLDR